MKLALPDELSILLGMLFLVLGRVESIDLGSKPGEKKYSRKSAEVKKPVREIGTTTETENRSFSIFFPVGEKQGEERKRKSEGSRFRSKLRRWKVSKVGGGGVSGEECCAWIDGQGESEGGGGGGLGGGGPRPDRSGALLPKACR